MYVYEEFEGHHHCPLDFEVNKVEIIFVRHAEAVSNVNNPADVDGYEMATLDRDKLRSLLEKLQKGQTVTQTIKNGEFFPDGLTAHGLKQAEAFGRETNLGNVYRVLATSCLRTYQTADCMARGFGLVSDEALVGDTPIIGCVDQFREATLWPHDLPPVPIKEPDGGRSASYIKIRGGPGPDRGKILGESRFSMNNSYWIDNGLGRWMDQEIRMDRLEYPRSNCEIVQSVGNFRYDLRGIAVGALREHMASGREGTPRIVVCLHGGIINFILGEWRSTYTRPDESSNWQWGHPSALAQMEAVVFGFESVADSAAKLIERERTPELEEALGRYYRNFREEDAAYHYVNPDGTVVNQKEDHMAFINKTTETVCAERKREKRIIQAFTGYTGAAGALEILNKPIVHRSLPHRPRRPQIVSPEDDGLVWLG